MPFLGDDLGLLFKAKIMYIKGMAILESTHLRNILSLMFLTMRVMCE
jgi:hypothetical protein